MKKQLLVLIPLLVFVGLALVMVGSVTASPAADCEASGIGYLTPLGSQAINFSCAADATVYFGVCDAGSVPNDDLFNIEFNGGIVAANGFSGGQEFVTIGEAAAGAGAHSALMNSLNVGIGEATYTYAISSDRGWVSSHLGAYCGSDFGGIADACTRGVPVFTMDAAPSNGTLKFNALFGAQSREEGVNLRTWDVVAGQQINNDIAFMPTPNWARLWWQPEGEDTWYLLPSQYWTGDGTRASEYGLDCESSGIPSYHTSFEDAIPADQVPAFDPS